MFRPGIDREAEARQAGIAGWSDLLTADDLYADAIECLQRLAADGYRLAIAANQPAPATEVIRAINALLPPPGLEFVGSSGDWGVVKPEPAFFARIAAELQLPMSAIAYVGDRFDNDVMPAIDAGMTAVFIRRGPWGWIQGSEPGAADAASLVIDTLAELAPALRRLDRT